MTADELRALVAAFGAKSLRREQWTHLAHLAVGAWHVHEYGADAALEHLRSGIRALNEALGGQNTESAGYHETITSAYVRLLDEFLGLFPDTAPLDGRVDSLLRSRLAEKTVLFRFWSKERLMSAEARAAWVPPDLAPLALMGDLRKVES